MKLEICICEMNLWRWSGNMRKKSNKSGKCQLVSETERGNFGSKQTPDKQTVGERFSKLFMLKIFLLFVFFRCFATCLGCHAIGCNLPGWTVQCLKWGWSRCPGSGPFPSRSPLPPRDWGAGVQQGGGWVSSTSYIELLNLGAEIEEPTVLV